MCNTYCYVEHFFISCPLLNELWQVIISNQNINIITKPLNKLSKIVLWYNNNEIEYFDLNLLFTIVRFSIHVYKYNVSDNRTKHCNLMKLFYYLLMNVKLLTCNIWQKVIRLKTLWRIISYIFSMHIKNM